MGDNFSEFQGFKGKISRIPGNYVTANDVIWTGEKYKEI